MAFDADEPQDTTKIRNLGTVIRPNWAAIEQAENTFKPYAINFINRSSIAAADNPTNISDAAIMFCKSDGSNPESFIMDAGGSIIQITQAQAIGSSTTPMKASQITFDGAGISIDNKNVATAWAYFNASGALQTGQNIASATRTVAMSTGQWDIKTTAVFNNANVGVFLSAFEPSGTKPTGINLLAAPTYATNVVTVQITTRNRSGSHVDVPFYIMLVGGI